jgi:hypothetical protein
VAVARMSEPPQTSAQPDDYTERAFPAFPEVSMTAVAAGLSLPAIPPRRTRLLPRKA